MAKRFIDANTDQARHVLVLTASNEARADLADAYARGSYRDAESLVGEALHEVYEFVAPEYIPGAMTDAPILVDSDSIIYADNGQIILLESARVYWFPNYAVRDPFEELKNKGRVEFVECEPYADMVEPGIPLDLDRYLPNGDREGFPIWISEAATEGTVPEIVDKYGQLTPGMYFWSGGERFGPYSGGVAGMIDAERDGVMTGHLP